MTQLSKELLCIVIRGGVELWAEKERILPMLATLQNKNAPQFITYEGRLINRADVVGIFTPEDMEAVKRRKNGQWQCGFGEWHDRGEKCECVSAEEVRQQNFKKFGVY